MLCATHSPLLASLPGATLLEVGTHVREVAYDDLDLVRDWRDFLSAPERYLRHLLSSCALPGTTQDRTDALRSRGNSLADRV